MGLIFNQLNKTHSLELQLKEFLKLYFTSFGFQFQFSLQLREHFNLIFPNFCLWVSILVLQILCVLIQIFSKFCLWVSISINLKTFPNLSLSESPSPLVHRAQCGCVSIPILFPDVIHRLGRAQIVRWLHQFPGQFAQFPKQWVVVVVAAAIAHEFHGGFVPSTGVGAFAWQTDEAGHWLV